MILGLEIRNFQNHKHSKYEFHPGSNIIVGLTDSGKSVVIRALEWVFFNRPLGEEFRSNWGGSTWVKVITEDYEVVRLRNDTENGYTLKNLKTDQVKSHFEAFKNGVPEEIIAALNINEVNVQSQFSPIFLLSQTSGEVAKYFNKVAKLDKIDTGLTRVNGWINQIQQDIKTTEKRITENTHDLLQFEDLDKFEADVEVLERLQSESIKKQSSINSLQLLFNRAEKLQKEMEVQEKILSIEPVLVKALSLIAERDKLKSDIRRLTVLNQDLKALEEALKERNALITIEKPLNTLIKLIEDRDTLIEKYNRLSTLMNQAHDLTVELDRLEIEHEQLHKTFEEYMGDICPLCDQPINIK